MLSQSWHNRSERTIGHKCDTLNLSVVLSDESQVRRQTGKTLPSGEVLSVDEHTVKGMMLSQVCVNGGSEIPEVSNRKCRYGFNDQDTFCLHDAMFDHDFHLQLSPNEARDKVHILVPPTCDLS